jgi:hypothetical protein
VRRFFFIFRRQQGRELEPGVIAVIQTSGDRIVDHLKLMFIAEKPPPHVFEQVAPMAAGERREYF